MCVQGFMKFRLRGFKILRKQSVTDGTDGRTDNVKTVYPPYNFVIAGGIIIWVSDQVELKPDCTVTEDG